MSSYLSDQEQLNLIREWLKKYGKLLSLSLTVFLLIFFGVHAKP
jgi:predicted negative regulator of RcsB-dependent stress response